MDRAQGRQQLAGHRQEFIARQGSLREVLLQALAFDKVRPQAGAAIVDAGAMHREDVWMTHPRQPPRLLDVGAGGLDLTAILAAQLQRHLALQQWIVGAIDVAESTAAQLRDDAQVTPLHRVT